MGAARRRGSIVGDLGWTLDDVIPLFLHGQSPHFLARSRPAGDVSTVGHLPVSPHLRRVIPSVFIRASRSTFSRSGAFPGPG
jgi:hypothetical protein